MCLSNDRVMYTMRVVQSVTREEHLEATPGCPLRGDIHDLSMPPQQEAGVGRGYIHLEGTPIAHFRLYDRFCVRASRLQFVKL